MKHHFSFFFILLILFSKETVAQDDPVYDNLVWSDEFETEGNINTANWFHQTQIPADGSWYNGEIQHYTNRLENTFVSDGILNIVAKKESFTDQGVAKEYTSARLNSKFAFTYGRVEIRAKMPFGVGTWPALWMLGKNITEEGAYWQILGNGTTPWPDCGEIDIMEHWGHNQNFVQSATHTPSSYGDTVNKGGQTITTVSDEFHIYSLDWYPDRLVFQVDGVTHYTYDPPFQSSDTWPFDLDHYFLFNVAILPSIQSDFIESALQVDYIRVYQESNEEEEEEEEELVTSLEDGITTLELFPNPVSDFISLVLPELDGQVAITIYGSDGSIIRNSTSVMIDNKLIINDLSGLRSGVYFINIQSENKYKKLSFIKN